MILRYIYGGRLSLEEYDTSNIIKLLIASNELNLQELITHLQLFLIKNKKDWMVQNFSLIYNTSFEKDSFLELQNFCKEFMFKEPKKIFDSRDFTSLPENCLITLIQHENFQNNVIQVWEHVLEWDLRDELIRHFINQSTNRPEPKTTKENDSKNIDSKIITKQHAELISKWIDKLDIKDEIENPYEFELILRGSRDGFSPKKFHEICDNKSHTISIIKVKGSNEILGGYNSIIWKSDDKWGTTKDSFIFSFKNKNSIKNYTLSRVKSEVCAIDNDPAHGPSFGSSDLELYENNRGGAFGPVHYETSIRSTNGEFSVEEYEIFQITKECEPEEESNCNIS
ncbi:carbohydrate-binding module family 13 protein [Rhizophagus irregularis DAOM 181602=DAOM 197198]|nr:carbohydrate-binding module family 13 protein [Rhizophagus irregularis DAOM 181602=DAOM 197198]